MTSTKNGQVSWKQVAFGIFTLAVLIFVGAIVDTSGSVVEKKLYGVTSTP